MSKIRSHFSAAEMPADSRTIRGSDTAPYIAPFGATDTATYFNCISVQISCFYWATDLKHIDTIVSK